MESYIFLIAALGTLGQATWPPTLSASKPTTQSNCDYKPPLETVTIPHFPSAPTSLSSHDLDEVHSLSSLPTEPSVSTGPPSALASLSSLPTANTPSSHRDTVQHTPSSAPMMHISSSHIPTVANSSSQPTSVVTSLSGASSARSSSSYVQDNLKTHTVTEYNTRMVTTTVATTVIAAVINHEAPCMKPGPAVWDTPRPHPITPVDASMEPGPTSCDPPHRLHGAVRPCVLDKNQAIPTPGDTLRKPQGTVGPYPSDSEKKHQSVPTSRDSLHESHGTMWPHSQDDDRHQAVQKPWERPRKPHGTVRQYPTDATKKYPHVITMLSEAACPPGFTCQPDDDYTENNLATRDEQCPKQSPHVCPEGYSCQMRKKLPPTVVEPPPYYSPRPVVSPPPPASPSTSTRPPAAPSPSAAVLDPAASSQSCPGGKHPCPHPSAETPWIPGTVTTAEAVLSMPAAAMYVMIAPIIGLFMV